MKIEPGPLNPLNRFGQHTGENRHAAIDMSRARKKLATVFPIGDIFATRHDEAHRAKRSRKEGLAVGRKWGAEAQQSRAAMMRLELRKMAAIMLLDNQKMRVKEIEASICARIKDNSAFKGKKGKTISNHTVSQMIKGVKKGVTAGMRPLEYL